MTKPKELIARWPLNKNFNLEGCNCITTCHAKIVTFEIAFEVLKDRWKIFGHFRQCSEVFGKLSECSEAAGTESHQVFQV